MTEPSKRNSDYVHYSSAGIQMVLTILLFTFGGIKLDAYFETRPLWTALLAIFGVVIAMIFMIKAFMKPPSSRKKEEKKEDSQEK
jgi:arginine exporter protein ArgO